MDAVGVDVAPVRTDWSAASLFFLAWMLIGTFIALNLFIGAIVDTFSSIRARSDGFVLMTPAQKQWTVLMRETRRLSVPRVARPPGTATCCTWLLFAPLRKPLHDLVEKSPRFEDFMLVVVILNTIVLACDYVRALALQPPTPRSGSWAARACMCVLISHVCPCPAADSVIILHATPAFCLRTL